MRFVPTGIDGAYVLELERLADPRGYFARTFCTREFDEHGLNPAIAQSSVSLNHRRGTVRGMHWQAPPAAETKLVRVNRGAIWDVIVDLRPGSPSFRRSFGVELSAAAGNSLYVPQCCAHGFQTLADDTEVSYQISEFFAPEQARGARWDDASLDVEWPLPVAVISEKDLAWPPLQGVVVPT